MHAEIIISGSGGQGVLLIGRILAEAGVSEGRQVSWVPTYGAEKRGGTVNCSIIISDEKIGALFTTRPNAAIAMNQAAAAKLEKAMAPDGLMIVNQSLMTSRLNRKDIKAHYVPANSLSAEVGTESTANFAILGALLAKYPVVSVASVRKIIDTMFARISKTLQSNKKAFKKGYDYGNLTPRKASLVSKRLLSSCVPDYA